MDSASIIVGGGFVVLTAVCIVLAKKLFVVSFGIACGIGIPVAFGVGMIAVWLLGRLSDRKRK